MQNGTFLKASKWHYFNKSLGNCFFEDAMKVQDSQFGELCGIDEIFEHA